MLLSYILFSLQPTSSTARLLAKKQRQQEEQRRRQGLADLGGEDGQFRRHYHRGARPKSCKYDSYRLRSRTSAVDESLFGEPLKNRLMLARSRSMEAIAAAANNNVSSNNNNNPDRLFVVREVSGECFSHV